MSTPATLPPPIPSLDTEALRRRLAGLADPLPREVGGAETAEIREAASRFCSILAHLFSDDLDRTTLWGRIDTAIATACARVSDADLDRLATICLDHVRADAGEAAACGPLVQLLESFAARPAEWRHAFVGHLHTHRYAVIVRGRTRWEAVKRKEVDL